MDKLWAPWRSKFLTNKIKKDCIFCVDKNPRQHKFIIKRSKCSFAILNIYPYNNGHIMVVPYRHVKDILSLSDKELMDLLKLLKDMQLLLKKKLNPDGFNIGINTGKAAGAGYKDHVHVHIVPRWVGDTNFMPVVSKTKIIPQSLEELYKLLKK